ncbi:MFS transporter [Alkalicella caledoniensis]|uniref:MFS transporter n=1 Tax=Alkalicella caledoniensis TaxID=2731377 RepID=A0A7G9W9P9_ALKCA|nr:MFS transporter [Alkalicella caledoniensis]QNO15411.1 MFS transporter [Alkalicella caledoniensis]
MNSNIIQNSELGMQNSKSNLWTKHYINTLIVSLIIFIPNIILVNVLPLFTLSIGGNNTTAGLLTSILTLSALICRPIFGKMLDSKGRRIVLIIGLSLFSFSTISLLAATNIFSLLALRFFQGIGLSGFSTALGTILSDVVPKERLSEGVGYFGISQTLATAIGPNLGLYLYINHGYQATYIVAFGISLFSIIFASFITYEKKTKNTADNNHKDMAVVSETAATTHVSQNKGFIEKSSIRPCIVLLLAVLPISSVFSFMPLFAVERGINNIGLFFTVFSISMVVAKLINGKAADRFGYSRIFFPAIIMMFMLFITLAYANSLPMVLLGAIFYGLGFGTVQPILNTIVIKLSPPERKGAANATYYATLDLSFGIGSFLWGVVSQIAGFTTVFLACALFVSLSAMAYYFVLHRDLVKNQSMQAA